MADEKSNNLNRKCAKEVVQVDKNKSAISSELIEMAPGYLSFSRSYSNSKLQLEAVYQLKNDSFSASCKKGIKKQAQQLFYIIWLVIGFCAK